MSKCHKLIRLISLLIIILKRFRSCCCSWIINLLPRPSAAPVLSGRSLRRLQRRRLRRRGQHPLERGQNSRVDFRLREPGSRDTHRVRPLAHQPPSVQVFQRSLNCLSNPVAANRRVYKERLGLPMKMTIGYQSHADTATKSGSTTKNKFVVWETPYVPLSFPCLICCWWKEKEKKKKRKTYCLLCCKKTLRNAIWKTMQSETTRQMFFHNNKLPRTRTTGIKETTVEEKKETNMKSS